MEILRPHREFDAPFTIGFFKERGYPIVDRHPFNGELRTAGPYIDCIDGRSHMDGPAIPGGIHGVAALLTGGNKDGYERAFEMVESLERRASFHGDGYHPLRGCGFFNAWEQGKLRVAHALHDVEDWLLSRILYKGRHDIYGGAHQESGLIINSFRKKTVRTNGERFHFDDWFMAQLGVPLPNRLDLLAQAIPLLVPEERRKDFIIEVLR